MAAAPDFDPGGAGYAMKAGLALGLLGSLALAVPAAEATFPGRSGLVAFSSAVRNRDGKIEIQVMRADGSGRRVLTHSLADDGAPAWSPDGTRIAFHRVLNYGDGRFNIEIFLMRADGRDVRQLTNHIGDDRDPAWSPDGRSIAFARTFRNTRELAVMEAAGGAIRVLVAGDFNAAPSWSPDGRRIVFERDRGYGSEIWIVRADGTGLRQLTRLSRPPGLPCEVDAWPDWSPDGTTIVFGRLSGGACENGQLYTIRPDGSGLKRLGPRNVVMGGPRYSPDGRSIVAVGPGGKSLVILTTRGAPTRSIPVEGFAGPPSWQSLRR